MKVIENQTVNITYTNWRGERGIRKIQPIEMIFKSTEWHPEEQWILKAYDFEREAIREFAMKDIEAWKDCP